VSFHLYLASFIIVCTIAMSSIHQCLDLGVTSRAGINSSAGFLMMLCKSIAQALRYDGEGLCLYCSQRGHISVENILRILVNFS
jgi:hypothetical protein